MKHDELRVAIRKGVNRELRMHGFRNRTEAEHSLGLTRSGNRSSGVRAEIFEIAVLDSTNELTNQSSEQDILRVTRRHVRRLVAEVNRRRDVPLDPTEENDASGPCFVGNGVFPLSALAARHVDDIDAEGELIEYLDRKRRLARFIVVIGVETWRWFLDYLEADRKPDNPRDRMRFSRLRKKLLDSVTNGHPEP